MADSWIGHHGNYALRSFHCRALALQPETDTKGRYEDGGQAVIPAGFQGREVHAA